MCLQRPGAGHSPPEQAAQVGALAKVAAEQDEPPTIRHLFRSET